MLTTQEKQQVEADASFLLKSHGVIKPPVPIYEIIKANLPGVKLLRANLVLGFRGCAFPLDNGEYGEWAITVSSRYDSEVNRFTAAHEFKHVLEGRQGFSTNGDARLQVARDSAKEKRRIDYFSACLLMPEEFVRQAWAELLPINNPLALQKRLGLRAKKLSELFKVSKHSMLIRFSELELVPSSVVDDALRFYDRYR